MRRKHDERGAAAVEFALVVPILCMLLLGTVTVAFAYSQKLSLNSAVREGARLGATAPSTSHAAWLTAVQGHTASTYGDGLSSADVCATLIKTTGGVSPTLTTIVSAPAGCGTGPDNPTNVAAGCFVKVWASKQTHLNWLLGSSDPFAEATAVAVYDRNETCS